MMPRWEEYHASLIDAERQLSDLVRRAAAGEEVIIDKDAQSAVRLVPVLPDEERQRRREILDEIWTEARRRRLAGEDPHSLEADNGHAFLYDENGLPG